jgi:hypothetical protein
MIYANEVGNQTQELDLLLMLQYNKRVQKSIKSFCSSFFYLIQEQPKKYEIW